MISVKSISKTYEESERPAVESVSFDIEQGELVVILGESGSGKSTTLKMINRLVEPTSGEILVKGKSVSSLDRVLLRRQIGYVFQEIGLFPHMTVAENIAVVPRLLNWSDSEIAERIEELLELLNLASEDLTSRFPAQLSGGQRQRVGVARALAARQEVMLMDEPFGALDPITRDSLQGEFRKLQNQLGLTVLMVTHDITEALLLADRVGVMKNGQLLELATPEKLVNSPKSDYAKLLIDMPVRQSRTLTDLIDRKMS